MARNIPIHFPSWHALLELIYLFIDNKILILIACHFRHSPILGMSHIKMHDANDIALKPKCSNENHLFKCSGRLDTNRQRKVFNLHFAF